MSNEKSGVSKVTVTVLDMVGIQQYVFRSNDLKHIVGASGLVHAATHEWVFETLVELGDTSVNSVGKDNERKIESDENLKSEVIYAGGGNVVLLFRGDPNQVARDFTKAYTRKVLIEASGLQPVIAHSECNWESDVLAKVVQDTFAKVNRKKQDRQYSVPLLGLGVTVDCQYTGLPAVTYEFSQDGTKHRISAEIQAKSSFFNAAENRLKKVLELPENWKLIRNFDDFGTRGKSSYLAVIHTDGNGVGKRIKDIAEKYARADENRDYIKNIRLFSQFLEDAATNALRESAQQLIKACHKRDQKIVIGKGEEAFEVQVRDGANLLPFRPIVFGGDDATFVCDGRLGLSLAEFYLRQLTSQILSDNRPLAARAGVVIVKTHHPFSRAVAMAGELAQSAKEYIKNNQKLEKGEISALDWHFATGGPCEDIRKIREREYTVQRNGRSKRLSARPVRLGKTISGDWHSWDAFKRCIHDFQGTNWTKRKNKIIALRDALRAGEDVVKQFRILYNLPQLPDISKNLTAKETGWDGDDCTCFDAIEALDYYVPLDGGEEK